MYRGQTTERAQGFRNKRQTSSSNIFITWNGWFSSEFKIGIPFCFIWRKLFFSIRPISVKCQAKEDGNLFHVSMYDNMQLTGMIIKSGYVKFVIMYTHTHTHTHTHNDAFLVSFRRPYVDNPLTRTEFRTGNDFPPCKAYSGAEWIWYSLLQQKTYSSPGNHYLCT